MAVQFIPSSPYQRTAEYARYLASCDAGVDPRELPAWEFPESLADGEPPEVCVDADAFHDAWCRRVRAA